MLKFPEWGLRRYLRTYLALACKAFVEKISGSSKQAYLALACKALVEKISSSISVDSDEMACSSHIAIAKKLPH